VLAETLSQAKQAESQRDLEVKKAQYLEVTKKQQAQADKAYDIQTNVMQQQVITENVRVQQVEKEGQVKVQDATRFRNGMRKAELAVDKKQDDLACAALLRVESYRDLSANFAQQSEDQKAQVENLKSALRNLDQKLAEANAKADLLIAQHRRARAANRATDAQSGMSADSRSATFDRMKKKVAREEAIGGAKAQLLAEDVEDRLAALEKEDRIEQLLTELKTKRGA
jgi:phage shock protein A